MNKVEVRAVSKKGMSPKEIHDDFIKTLLDESPTYSTMKKLAAEYTRGTESVGDYKRSGRP